LNRAVLQQLSEDRILDAEALLASNRWSGAYYLAGYAVECGLKSCIILHVINTGIIFQDQKWASKCWTHDLEDLVRQAGLENERGIAIATNPTLGSNWMIAKDWNERSRYEQKTEAQARGLYDAINDNVNGVLQWIRGHW
jgi:HEPN domain-containing protein